MKPYDRLYQIRELSTAYLERQRKRCPDLGHSETAQLRRELDAITALCEGGMQEDECQENLGHWSI